MSNSIMTRMKKNYEWRSRHFLTKRIPVIMRIDGKAFHTYTAEFEKPFDNDLISWMRLTAKYLCENIQGAKCAYVQSDEISILITDYDKLNTEAWFDYNVQKMTSISASMAAGIFNHLRIQSYFNDGSSGRNISEQFVDGTDLEGVRDDIASFINYYPFNIRLAAFDSRVFNVPKEEVCNYFIARYRDATKNSVAMLAQSAFSSQELKGKSKDTQIAMLKEKDIHWLDLDYAARTGTFVQKAKYVNDLLLGVQCFLNRDNNGYEDFNGNILENPTIRTRWIFDKPHFDNFRDQVEQYVFLNKKK